MVLKHLHPVLRTCPTSSCTSCQSASSTAKRILASFKASLLRRHVTGKHDLRSFPVALFDRIAMLPFLFVLPRDISRRNAGIVGRFSLFLFLLFFFIRRTTLEWVDVSVRFSYLFGIHTLPFNLSSPDQFSNINGKNNAAGPTRWSRARAERRHTLISAISVPPPPHPQKTARCAGTY